MKKINFLAIFLFLQWFITSFVYALDCENEQDIKHVLKQVNLKFSSSDLVSCKINPQNKNQLLMAYAMQEYDAQNEVENYQLYIIGMNNKKVYYFYAVEKALVQMLLSFLVLLGILLLIL